MVLSVGQIFLIGFVGILVPLGTRKPPVVTLALLDVFFRHSKSTCCSLSPVVAIYFNFLRFAYVARSFLAKFFSLDKILHSAQRHDQGTTEARPNSFDLLIDTSSKCATSGKWLCNKWKVGGFRCSKWDPLVAKCLRNNATSSSVPHHLRDTVTLC